MREGYKQNYIDYIGHDYLKNEHYIERFSNLRINEVTLEDSLHDPFEEATDEIEYLEANSASLSELQGKKYRSIYHAFNIDVDKQIFKRQRYSFWHLLADAGGLHDGLSVIACLMLNPF